MAQPFSYSVRQLLLELGLHVNDSLLLYATGDAADTTHFDTTMLAGRTASSLVDSELWPWDIPAGSATPTLRRPQLVAANTAGGLLTLDPAVFSTVYRANNRAVLQNIQGRGHPQEKKEYALKMAMLEVYALDPLAVQTIAAPSTTDFWNALPAALRSVYRVAGWNDFTGQEFEIPPAVWQDRLDVAGWRANLALDWQAGDEIRVYGRVDPAAWWDSLRDPATGVCDLAEYAATVPGDPRRLLAAALPHLLDSKRDDHAREQLEFAYQRTLRASLERAMPNEVFRL